MPLELDDRQRAMLLEMGVRVWLPGTAFAVAETAAPTLAAAAPGSSPRQADTSPVRVSAGPSPADPAEQRLRSVAPRSAPVQAPGAHPANRAPVPASGLDLRALDAAALADAADHCQACGLCSGRKQSTLRAEALVGQADWLVVGDPPDEEEDNLGTPFAGQSGLLLGNMLKAMGARVGASGAVGAYVTNVVKCRPPMARLPQPAELAQCAAYLQRELTLVQPKVILAMGRFAIQLLLEEHPQQAGLPLGKQRGMVYSYQGIPVVVTYAPKALLRTSADKAKAWADLCLAMDVRDGVECG